MIWWLNSGHSDRQYLPDCIESSSPQPFSLHTAPSRDLIYAYVFNLLPTCSRLPDLRSGPTVVSSQHLLSTCLLYRYTYKYPQTQNGLHHHSLRSPTAPFISSFKSTANSEISFQSMTLHSFHISPPRGSPCPTRFTYLCLKPVLLCIYHSSSSVCYHFFPHGYS